MILVCGGAGYIGSHCTRQLIRKGYEVVVIDDLSTGYEKAVDKKAVFYKGRIQDTDLLNEIFTNHNIEAVVHFAANSLVAESMRNPLKYYGNNVGGTINLLKSMVDNRIRKIVFSSTASVYGNTSEEIISEEATPNPTNVYGQTKLTIENLLRSLEQSDDIKSIVFRYFNVAGADDSGEIGESHNPETHLIPIILQVAQGKRKSLDLYGTDYNTEDGTCVRDYIHVVDLVDAHILAIESLLSGCDSNIYNLGNGRGFSNLEIIKASRIVTGHKIPVVHSERRAGDPDSLIASYEKVSKELGWKPKYNDLNHIIATAWNWHKYNPNGFMR